MGAPSIRMKLRNGLLLEGDAGTSVGYKEFRLDLTIPLRNHSRALRADGPHLDEPPIHGEVLSGDMRLGLLQHPRKKLARLS